MTIRRTLAAAAGLPRTGEPAVVKIVTAILSALTGALLVVAIVMEIRYGRR